MDKKKIKYKDGFIEACYDPFNFGVEETDDFWQTKYHRKIKKEFLIYILLKIFT